MLCVGKKNKNEGGASKTAPKPSYSGIETATSPDSAQLTRKKSFYGPLEDLIPVKVDFLQMKKSGAAGGPESRFFILTDSVLVCFDERVNDKSHTDFEKHILHLKSLEIRAGSDLSIQVVDSESKFSTTLVLRNTQHMHEWLDALLAAKKAIQPLPA